jgi:hypothetical protein
MTRLIAILALFILTLISLFAPLVATLPGTVLIGGEYTVQPGEIRRGDLLALFAQVKIAEGGEVDGQVRVYGGELVVAGNVAKNVQSFGSKLTVNPTAQITGKVNSIDYLRGWFLLPSILLVIS